MTELAFSLSGQVVVTDTDPVAEADYYAMHALTDVVVASMEWNSGYDATGDWSDITTIPKGAVLAGRFRTLTLTSGQAILHKE